LTVILADTNLAIDFLVGIQSVKSESEFLFQQSSMSRKDSRAGC
jgi:hypothetical protein